MFIKQQVVVGDDILTLKPRKLNVDIGLKIGISQVYRIVSLAFSLVIADKKQLKPSINEPKLAVF